jgi:hypothetical protein
MMEWRESPVRLSVPLSITMGIANVHCQREFKRRGTERLRECTHQKHPILTQLCTLRTLEVGLRSPRSCVAVLIHIVELGRAR